MPVMQVAVNPPTNTSYSDGQSYNLLGGKQGEAILAQLHGKYTTQTYRGKMIACPLVSAVAIPIDTTTAPTFNLWNPAGNNVAFVAVAYLLGYTAGSGVIDTLGYYELKNAGATEVASGTISVFTNLTIRTGILGQSYGGNLRFGTTATILTTTLTLNRRSCFSQAVPTATDAAIRMMAEYFDGTLIVPPNTMFSVAASAASVDTFLQTLVGYEVPWP